jgi:hypothetical protein
MLGVAQRTQQVLHVWQQTMIPTPGRQIQALRVKMRQQRRRTELLSSNG